MSRTVYGDRTALELGTQAAEAIRGLNHLTRDAGSLAYPSEVYSLLGDLGLLAERLPQLLTQLGQLVASWVDEGHVTIDAGEHDGGPTSATEAAVEFGRQMLEQARPAADELAIALNAARAAIAAARYTGPDPDADSSDDAP